MQDAEGSGPSLKTYQPEAGSGAMTELSQTTDADNKPDVTQAAASPYFSDGPLRKVHPYKYASACSAKATPDLTFSPLTKAILT